MHICFTRFSFGFSLLSLLSFIHVLSGYTRDMIDVSSALRAGGGGPRA
jgi:hypothetical protein